MLPGWYRCSIPCPGRLPAPTWPGRPHLGPRPQFRRQPCAHHGRRQSLRAARARRRHAARTGDVQTARWQPPGSDGDPGAVGRSVRHQPTVVRAVCHRPVRVWARLRRLPAGQVLGHVWRDRVHVVSDGLCQQSDRAERVCGLRPGLTSECDRPEPMRGMRCRTRHVGRRPVRVCRVCRRLLRHRARCRGLCRVPTWVIRGARRHEHMHTVRARPSGRGLRPTNMLRVSGGHARSRRIVPTMRNGSIFRRGRADELHRLSAWPVRAVRRPGQLRAMFPGDDRRRRRPRDLRAMCARTCSATGGRQLVRPVRSG